MAVQMAQQRKQIDDQIKQHQESIRKLQQQRNAPAGGMAESRRRLKESEVQQAQVVLASQDMVDQVQKMIEQVTSMQFKDLPALVDQIKNEVGIDQAQQFNADATAALAGLTQNLQGSKGQLETALGVVTGQAPAVPGQELATPVADMGAELPPEAGEEELDLDLDVEEEPSSLETTLGRGKR
jgi:DNA repair exonuclease SbcCD ATPase subunit